MLTIKLLELKLQNAFLPCCLPVWDISQMHCNIFLGCFYFILDDNSFQFQLNLLVPFSFLFIWDWIIPQYNPDILASVYSLLLHQMELALHLLFHLTLNTMLFGCIGNMFLPKLVVSGVITSQLLIFCRNSLFSSSVMTLKPFVVILYFFPSYFLIFFLFSTFL